MNEQGAVVPEAFVPDLSYSGSGKYADSPVILLNSEITGAAFDHRSPTTDQTEWTGDDFRVSLYAAQRLP